MNSHRARPGRVLRGPAAPALRLRPLRELPAAAPAPAASGPAGGYEDGYVRGHAEGYAAGQEQAAAEADTARRRIERALSALAVAARSLEERHTLCLDGLAGELAGAALSLAEAVLGRELASVADPGADALARALAFAPAAGPATARLHPDDAATLEGAAVPPGVAIVADPEVEPAGCLLDVGDTRIDAQLGPALARARAVLLGEEQ